MKYIIAILLFLFSGNAIAQAPNITAAGSATQLMYNKGTAKTDKQMILPRSFVPYSTIDSTGCLWFDSVGTKTLWFHNGTTRVQVAAGGGGGSGTVTSVTGGGYMLGGTILTAGTLTPDTSAGKLATKTNLNLKVNYTDTPLMLAPYAKLWQIPTNNNQLTNGAGYITGYTETDPVANAKTVTIASGYGIIGGGAAQALSTNPARTLILDTAVAWPALRATIPSGGTGTVTQVNVATANGFGGTVANATTTPNITVKTTVTGIMKGDGTSASAAVAGTDYQAPISFTTGSVPFMGASALSQDNADFFWDAANMRLGIQTNAPATALDVRGVSGGTGSVGAVSVAQSWSGAVSPTAVKVAVSDASSGTGKLQEWLGGASGTTSRMALDRNGNLVVQSSVGTTNIYGSAGSAALGIRNQTGNLNANNIDGISVFKDRAGTNVMTSVATAGTTNLFAIYPTYAQGTSSTAINNDVLVDRTETSIGTGTEQNFINFKVAGTSKFKISNAGVVTLTGRINTRDGNTTSSATPTINTDLVDQYRLTAQAVDITSFTTNLSGTPIEGQHLIISVTGTAARLITWGASFEASTVALPTTTVTTNMLSVLFIYNSVTSKWRCARTW